MGGDAASVGYPDFPPHHFDEEDDGDDDCHFGGGHGGGGHAAAGGYSGGGLAYGPGPGNGVSNLIVPLIVVSGIFLALLFFTKWTISIITCSQIYFLFK